MQDAKVIIMATALTKIFKLKLIIAVSSLSLAAPFIYPTVTYAGQTVPTDENICNNDKLTPAQKESCKACDKLKPNLKDCLQKNPIVKQLNIIVSFLSALAGIAIIGTIILGGIQYSLAGDSPQAVSAARQRIINGFIALTVFLFIAAFLQWVVPGGIFN